MITLSDLFSEKKVGGLLDLREKALLPSLDDATPNNLSDLFNNKNQTIVIETSTELEERLEAISETDPKINTDDCGTLDDIPTEDLGLLVDRIENISPALTIAVSNAEANGLIICDLANSHVTYNGVYDHALNMVGVNTDKTTAMRTATEEFVHSYQDHPRIDFNDYTLPDFNLWKMGIEAQAKLSVAVEAVRLKHSTDPDTALFDAHKTGAHFAVSQFLDQEVQAKGLAALEDTEVLAEGFKTIMGNKHFSSSYIAVKVPGYGVHESAGLQEIKPEDFIRHFGTVVGGNPRNNFLENIVTDKQDIIDMLPDNSKLTFKLQMQKIPTLESTPSHEKGFTYD